MSKLVMKGLMLHSYVDFKTKEMRCSLCGASEPFVAMPIEDLAQLACEFANRHKKCNVEEKK